MLTNSTTRFSNRVEDYVKYRPHYPVEIIPVLQQKYNISTNNLVLDIGAGTGISAELFLNAGYKVIAVEPNKEMREKSVELLGSNANFIAKNGTAEDTGVESNTIDVIICGQAFHWFDREKSRIEFQRVLRENGKVLLLWNERLTASAFESKYDELISTHGKDYVKVNHRNIDIESIKDFLHPGNMVLETFHNKQLFDFVGLQGRLLSSSYMPSYTDPAYTAMIDNLQKLFNKHEANGQVQINYETKVYIGNFDVL